MGVGTAVATASDGSTKTFTFSVPDKVQPSGLLFGSSIKSANTYAQFKSWGVKPQVHRVFYPNALPAKWSNDDTLPTSGLAIISYKTEMDPAAVTAFFASAPKGVTVYATWHHEVEDNIEKGNLTLAHFRSMSAIQCDAIAAGGAVPGLILMGYSTAPASGRNPADYLVAGKHKWVGVDFYSERDMTNIVPRTAAFAKANGIFWGITECGMAAQLGTEAQRIAYAKELKQYILPTDCRFASWWSDMVKTTFDVRLTQGIAQAFLPAA